MEISYISRNFSRCSFILKIDTVYMRKYLNLALLLYDSQGTQETTFPSVRVLFLISYIPYKITKTASISMFYLDVQYNVLFLLNSCCSYILFLFRRGYATRDTLNKNNRWIPRFSRAGSINITSTWQLTTFTNFVLRNNEFLPRKNGLQIHRGICH